MPSCSSAGTGYARSWLGRAPPGPSPWISGGAARPSRHRAAGWSRGGRGATPGGGGRRTMASSLASTTSFGRAVAQEQPALRCRMRPAARCSLRCAGKGEGAGREAAPDEGSIRSMFKWVRDPKGPVSNGPDRRSPRSNGYRVIGRRGPIHEPAFGSRIP